MTGVELRVHTAIAGLGYDFSRFTVSHFIDHLQILRERDIILNGLPFEPGLHGFWVRAETADYVFYNRNTHRVHHVHHILHELGHLVLDHQPHDLALFLSPTLVAQLRISTTAAPHGHCRMWTPDDSLDEHEAELFVRCLQREIIFAGRLAALTHPASSIEALTRFTRNLGDGD